MRDSAGIIIVENPSPALPPSRMWRISPQPYLDIARAEGDSLYEFQRVMGIVRLSDGRIAVGNGGTNTIRFYDARGAYLRAAGRGGRGPGEFTQILGLGVSDGDTLVALDLNQVHYYSADGELVRTMSAQTTNRSFIGVQGVFGDGSYVGLSWMRVSVGTSRRGTWVDSAPIFRVSSDGSRQESLGMYPIGRRSESQLDRRGMQVVFGPRVRLTAAGSHYYVGFPDRYEIGVYSPQGRLQRIIRRSIDARRVLPSDVAEYKRRLIAAPGEDGRNSPELTARRRRYASELTFAQAYPAFSRILVDRTGHVWVKRYESWEDAPDRWGLVRIYTNAEPSPWDVFTPDGRWLGVVDMPASFAPLDIGRDYVGGIWHDEDEMEHPRFYRIVRP
jgi:hypothetical protein